MVFIPSQSARRILIYINYLDVMVGFTRKGGGGVVEGFGRRKMAGAFCDMASFASCFGHQMGGGVGGSLINQNLHLENPQCETSFCKALRRLQNSFARDIWLFCFSSSFIPSLLRLIRYSIDAFSCSRGIFCGHFGF